jgi:transcriptional regulator with XRE-family HTH domain
MAAMRERAGITQQKLAEAADLSVSSIQKWEREEVENIGLKQLNSIAAALSVFLSATNNTVLLELLGLPEQKEQAGAA